MNYRHICRDKYRNTSNIIVFMSLIAAIFIGYSIFDVVININTSMCDIKNCTLIYDDCCKPFIMEQDHYEFICNPCYHADINYTLTTSDSQIYRKTRKYNIYDRHFCNQSKITCYFDNRNILSSLRLIGQYNPSMGLLAVLMCSIFLVISAGGGLNYFIRVFINKI